MNINIRIPWWVKGDVMVNFNGIEEFKNQTEVIYL